MRTTLSVIAASLAGALALNNGLGRTPQMGYNSWYDAFMSPSEDLVRQTVAALKSTGLYDAGYRYVNLDDGIVEVNRDSNGNLVPDTKGFPNGFKEVADFIHSQGMLFGVYTDRGPQTCGGRAAAFGHEAQDATFYAANDIDYVKEDSCNAAQDHPTAYHEYSLMRDGLNATGRPIFFSLCGWETWYAPVGHALGNSWRIGPDDTNWNGILSDIDDMASLYSYAGPGGWNDPCLLLGYDMNGNPAVTDQQGRAQFSMWAVLAAPMLLSQNVRNLTQMQLETYLNTEVIAVGQDEMGRQGQRVLGGTLSIGDRLSKVVKTGDSNTPITVQQCITSPHTGAAVTTQQWQFNTPASNYVYNSATQMCFNLDDCSSEVIAFACVTSGGTCCGSDCYDIMKFTLNADGTFTNAANPGQCVTSNGVGTQVDLETCVPNAKNQQFTYNNATGAIQSIDGCLTVGGNETRYSVFARPLSDGAYALTFINAGNLPVDVSCGAECLAVTGWDSDQTFTVRDLWAHSYLPDSTVSAGINVTALAADGGVAMYRVTPSF